MPAGPPADVAEALDPQLLAALHDVTDPELPVSVVDMGLIVGLQRDGQTARVQLTFTAMGCPCMEFIVVDIRARLLREPGVRAVEVEIVWEPVWTKARLSDDGVDIMRAWGVSA